MRSEHRPEWLRPKEVPKHFGIGRSKIYELIATGKVKSVSLRKRGQKHGTRLVSYDSLSAYLDSIAEGGDAIRPPPTNGCGDDATHPKKV